MRLIPTAAAVLAAAALAGSALASDLDLELRSGGATVVNGTPGQTLTYELVGQLTDTQNEGLAAFSVDLFFSGGALTPLADPTAGPLLQFLAPDGMNNPAGFGGTPDNGMLLQIGGAQNTMKASFGIPLPPPNGAVAVDVAKGAEVVLATGSLTVPTAPGTYSVNIMGAFANIIAAGETGDPFYQVEQAEIGTRTPLVINVGGALSVNQSTLSVGAGGSATFDLDAGAVNAGRRYLLLGSLTGVTPPMMIDTTFLPLAMDGYTSFTYFNVNSSVLANNFADLDPTGKATATLNIAAGAYPQLAGMTAHHAFLLVEPFVDYASNAASVLLAP